jgi:hypothetical protein
MRFVIVYRVRYHQDYHIREDGMDDAFSTQGEKCIAYKVVGGRIILKLQKVKYRGRSD